MISAWWLVLIMPICVTIGMIFNGIFNSTAQIDLCSQCHYNCKICPKNKEAN